MRELTAGPASFDRQHGVMKIDQSRVIDIHPSAGIGMVSGETGKGNVTGSSGTQGLDEIDHLIHLVEEHQLVGQVSRKIAPEVRRVVDRFLESRILPMLQ